VAGGCGRLNPRSREGLAAEVAPAVAPETRQEPYQQHIHDRDGLSAGRVHVMLAGADQPDTQRGRPRGGQHRLVQPVVPAARQVGAAGQVGEDRGHDLHE